MAKKDRTPEQIQADKDRMAKARAARTKKTDPAPTSGTTISNETLNLLLQRLANEDRSEDQGNSKTLYSLEKDDYDDPTDRLLDLPELRKFAMRDNYILKWKVEMAQYQKVDGIWYREPRFVVELYRHPWEEELAESREKGGALTPEAVIFENRHMQVEDDIAARQIATDLKLKVGVDFADFDELMDEMRFLRIKKWLVDYLIPPAPPSDNVNAPRELAVGGTVKKVHNLGGGEVMVEGERILK